MEDHTENLGRPRRTLVLPNRGTLLVSTDLHGNLADLTALERRFEHLLATAPAPVHWALLGDLVHGPSDEARGREPLFDFPDESWAVVARVLELSERLSGQVHFVLGNHDYAHIGGRHTGKFHDDEVAFLESQLTHEQKARMWGFFRQALLAMIAPCGLLLSHGAPDSQLRSLSQLDAIDLSQPVVGTAAGLLETILCSYGQTGAEMQRTLGHLSRTSGYDLSLCIHGHDKDEDGFFLEGTNQVCPVLFGARTSQKRFLRFDLGARYTSLEDVREGIELQRLYGGLSGD